jgi:hypothetical protein
MAIAARSLPVVGFSSALHSIFLTRLLPVLLAGALSLGVGAAAPTPQAGTPAAGSPSIKVTGISPSAAPAVATGEIAFPAEVKVTGENFLPGATVQIGSQNAGIVSVSATEIHALAPGEAVGTVDVTVTNPSGTSATLSKAFAYTTGPLVYGISPQTGNATEETVIVITGGNLANDSTVTVGGKAAPIQFYFSRASLRAQVPANTEVASGGKTVGAVTVTNSDGQSFTLPDAFTWTREPSATPGAAPVPVSDNETATETSGLGS